MILVVIAKDNTVHRTPLPRTQGAAKLGNCWVGDLILSHWMTSLKGIRLPPSERMATINDWK